MGNQLLRALGCLDLMGSTGYGVGYGGGATVVNTKRKRPRLGKDGLAEADQTNQLLDKWRPSDVRQLMRAFKSSIAAAAADARDGQAGENATGVDQAVADGDGGSNSLSKANKKKRLCSDVERMDLSAFRKVFSDLAGLPDSVAHAAFGVFDKQKTGNIDFREFCTAVAICCLSDRQEQVNFVFDLFDQKCTGKLSKNDVRLLLETAVHSTRCLAPASELTGAGADGSVSDSDMTSRSQDEEWIKKAEAELLSSSPSSVSRKQFHEWASNSLGVTAILNTFRIFPAKAGQFAKSSCILNEWKGLVEGDEVYIVSVSWWEEWCDYIGLSVQRSSSSGMGKSQYVRRRTKGQSFSSGDLSENDERCAVSTASPAGDSSDSSTAAIATLSSPAGAGHKTTDITSPPQKSDSAESFTPPSSSAPSPSSTTHVRAESVEVDAGNMPASPATATPILRQLSMHNYGDRPGPIDNSDLCGDVAGSIKVNLKEGHGYVLIPPKLWTLLYQWYGVHGDKGNDADGPTIFKRKVIRPGGRSVSKGANASAAIAATTVPLDDLDASFAKLATQFYIPPLRETGVRVEVHPLLLRYCVMDVRTGRPAYNSKQLAELSGTFSAAVTVSTMKARMCSDLGLGSHRDEEDDNNKSSGGGSSSSSGGGSSNKETRKGFALQSHTRLWVKPRGEDWRLLVPPSDDSSATNANANSTAESESMMTAEDVDLASGDFVMVEHMVLKDDAEGFLWPRERVELRKTTYRDFEINSPLDALDRENKWYSGTVKEILRDRDTGEIVEVLVKFDKFPNPKYDEAFAPDSEKLAPVYTHTLPSDDEAYAIVARDAQQRTHRSGKSTLAGRAPAQGAVGLINLGNTCYMASTLQGLSNTPLLRSYFTSGKYDAELNLQNKEGTGGYLTQALADLIRRLWSDQSHKPLRAVAPRPFKRALGQFRPQFQGYDQQDAHEFLLTVLSAVHEDTNRCDPELDKNKNNKDAGGGKKSKSKSKSAKVKVTDSNANHTSDAVGVKGEENGNDDAIVAPPDVESTMEGDDAASGVTTADGATVGAAVDADTPEKKNNADEGMGTGEEKQSGAERGRSRSNSVTLDLALASVDAWAKHKEKSHSIIVDLFHGQSCRSNICEECGHRISRFEPFPCLSINLRVQFAHKISVVRLPPVPPAQVSTESAPNGSTNDARQKNADARYAADLNAFRRVLQFGVLTPQVGLIGDLKLALAQKCGIRSNRLSIAAGDRENLQFMGDHNQLRTVGEDQTLIAFELPTGFQDIAGHPSGGGTSTKNNNRTEPGSAGRDVDVLTPSKSKDRSQKKSSGLCPCPCRQPVHVDPRGSKCLDENGSFITGNYQEEGDAGREDEDKVNVAGEEDEVEHDEYNTGGRHLGEGQNKKIKRNNRMRFVLDERVDARDFEGNWYPGTIVEVQLEDEDQKQNSEKEHNQDVQRTRLRGKLDGAPAGDAVSDTPPPQTTNEKRMGRVLVNFDGFASRFNEWFDIGESRRLFPVYTQTVQPPQKLIAALLLHRVRKKSAIVGEKEKLVTAAGTTVVAGQVAVASEAANANDDTDDSRFFGTPRQIWFGSRLPSSDVHGIVALHIDHLIIKSDADRKSGPPYTLLILKRRNDGTYGKPRPVMKTAAPPALKKNEILVAEWDSPNSFNYQLDTVQADESVAEALGQRGSEQKRNDERLTLEHCLGEYGNVETLSEDYKCDKCSAKGTTKTKVDIWRLPDILVIHMKRFVYTMYVRGKLNNLVHYPIRGLDMRPFLSAEARDAMAEMKEAKEVKEARNEASSAHGIGGGEGGGGGGGDGDTPLDDMYDLYAVVHHVGTMNGGHYVSTCRVKGDGDNWYQFNDRNVTPISEDQIVSPTGYILFYKRRELSSANVINLSL